MRIRQYVQSGEEKTVAQVFQKFQESVVIKNFGRMFSLKRNWEIEGFSPDPTDVAECEGKNDDCEASIRIGKAVKTHLHEPIKTPRPWPSEEKSEYLQPVKNGRCGECAQIVSDQCRNELKMSKEVFCEGCGVRLFERAN
jgi:hypothetical protein